MNGAYSMVIFIYLKMYIIVINILTVFMYIV